MRLQARDEFRGQMTRYYACAGVGWACICIVVVVVVVVVHVRIGVLCVQHCGFNPACRGPWILWLLSITE